MGGKLRRVPKGWVHPTDQPLYDRTYEEALAEWQEAKVRWDRRQDKYADEKDYAEYTFEEWQGKAPDPEYYRPAFENPNHYQVYETITEGTPISPVFETLEEVRAWCKQEGWSDFGISSLIEGSGVPSLIISPSQGVVFGTEWKGK